MKLDNNRNKIRSKTEEAVDRLLKEGFSTACDDSTVDVEYIDKLPDWYDEEKFKRGQKYFHDNIFVMLFAKICGLLTILAVPSILRVLIMTNMSNTPLKAFRRYMATIKHMYLWYSDDLKPSSDLWNSLKDIRNRHFQASRKAHKNNISRITQADMTLTQFGFMGYVIIKPEAVGIYGTKEADLEGFIHFWKVIGHLLGIQDRFNLCRDTIEETKEYCNLLLEKELTPRLRDVGQDYKKMSYSLINGMTAFQPFLNFPVMMHCIHQLCGIADEENSKKTKIYEMKFKHKMLYNFFLFHMYVNRFYVFRLYHNMVQYLAFFLITYFPFLAFLKYGLKNSYLPPIINKQKSSH